MHPVIPRGLRIMASIEKRMSKNGRTITWRVKWRTGGARDGAGDTETCDDLKTARRFKALVDAAGEQRPAGYPKGCRGKRLAAETEPESEPAEQTDLRPPQEQPRRVRSFGQVVEEYLGQLKRAERRQVADYRRRWQQHVESAVVTLTDGRRVGPLGALPIDQVTSEVLQAWVIWMEQRRWGYGPRDTDPKPYSPKTIANIHGGIICPALGFAARSEGRLLACPRCLPTGPWRLAGQERAAGPSR
jgi:hypothetical protein